MSQKAIIGLWRSWYAKQIGVDDEKKILIDGKHGRAAKELIAHLKEAHPENTPVEVLEAVLNNWQRLPDIYRDNCKELHSIKKNWNNIINKIKNGTGSKQAEIDRAINDIQRG